MVWTPAQHDALLHLCHRYGVQRLWLFGSAATGGFDPARSDLDFEAVLVPTLTGEALGQAVLALWNALEDLFGRQVDLLTVHPIHNPYLRAEVERTRVLLYDREGEEVPV